MRVHGTLRRAQGETGSDVVVHGEVPDEARRNMELWIGGIAGALQDTEFDAKLRPAGFADVDIEPWREYSVEDARAFLTEGGLDVDALAPQVEGTFLNAFVRARKPEAQACCGPGCCA